MNHKYDENVNRQLKKNKYFKQDWFFRGGIFILGWPSVVLCNMSFVYDRMLTILMTSFLLSKKATFDVFSNTYNTNAFS